MSPPFVLRWGVLGTGYISTDFVKDLVLSPEGRAVSDVAHAIAAVGSRSLERAEQFIRQVCPQGGFAQIHGLVDTQPVPKGSYQDVYELGDVDIIYVGTPHTSHYQDCRAALEAGKHVLLEKARGHCFQKWLEIYPLIQPATLNQAEFAGLAQLAQSKKLFLMEAVWTRFFPLTYALQNVLFKDKVIGDIRRVFSDFSMAFTDVVPETHRLLNPLLAGGGLLDLGPYPLVWAMLTLFHHPENELESPANISGSMMRDSKTGIDLLTNWTLDFPKLGARASLSVSICVNSAKECVTRIQGTKGEIIIPWLTARPESFTIRRAHAIGLGPQACVEEICAFPIEGTGLYWEADAVARSIRDGETENERMPLNETLLTMRIFDEVRMQGGYSYPEGLEQVKLT